MNRNNDNSLDRLCLAYSRLNSGEWDEIVGPKPEGFDGLPDFSADKRTATKEKATYAPMKAIESIVGEARLSHYHFLHVLGKTEDEWFRWYMTERFRQPE